MDTNINESCKEASHEDVRLKFVKLKESTNGKCLDPIWSHFFRSTESKHKTLSGRLHFMRKHIIDQCNVISSDDRATFIRSMNNKDAPVNLADEMKASSQKRFEMKNEAEVDETATKGKKSGSTISAYLEKKLDKKAKNIFI